MDIHWVLQNVNRCAKRKKNILIPYFHIKYIFVMTFNKFMQLGLICI